MNGRFEISGWPGRLAVFTCIMVLPFAGFLISSGYPIATAEAAAGLLCLLSVAAIFAAACRGFAFYAATLVSGTLMTVVPARQMLSPVYDFSTPALMGIIALAAGAFMLLFREALFRVLLIFAAGAFCAHALQALWIAAAPDGVFAGSERGSRPGHFLYLVLDEHMGPGGLPAGIAACRQAAGAIESTFAKHGFRLYPYAWSNFTVTLDSIPSLLNRRVPPERLALLHPGSPDAYGIYSVDARRFFAGARSRGYEVRVIQDRTVNYTRGEEAKVIEFSGQMGALAGARDVWTEKFRLLVGNYQDSNPVLWRVKGFLPFRFGSRPVGPLSAASVWPGKLLSAILAAPRPTFFFVHLMTPHSPYAYCQDGSIRPLKEWANDNNYWPVGADQYENYYRRYAEQLIFLQSQLRYLFAALDRQGLLDPMTVVVHGDHGSRIRKQMPGLINLEEQDAIDSYDYTGEPDLQDVLNRFSALLAIKFPGRQPASVCMRKASLLRFLGEDLYHEEPSRLSPETDSAFLFDRKGNARRIQLGDLWNP